jgi:hypothetical protein
VGKGAAVNLKDLDAAIGKLSDDLESLRRARTVLVRMNGATTPATDPVTDSAKGMEVEWRPLAVAYMQDGHYHGPKEVLTHLERTHGLKMNYGTVSSWMIRSREMQKHPRKRGQFKLMPKEEVPKVES